jgi:hypothetical protein
MPWYDRFLPRKPVQMSISAVVNDSAGWTSLTGRPHDYDPSQVQDIYQDALTAWRKNPIAWRIIAITTDYVVGDAFSITSRNRALNKFIMSFWHHPKNMMDLRLETMCDELSRSGDLFVLLFRNDADGMSYIRFVTKDQISKIECAPNDWETELTYYELTPTGETHAWPSAHNPAAMDSPAVMLHYSVNRPLGALLGESDLTTMLPWLQRYSRMLEDRVRLHWAIRSFMWLVTVPANKIQEKREQYRTPPETGAIIVKDETETWQAVTPEVRGTDAARDLQAVRMMVDAGSGYPPHWRGEAADANLATATAMQAPTERHLLRRQQYFSFMLQDILYQAYQRSMQIGINRRIPETDYTRLFQVNLPDISRSDNETLARSARDVSQAMSMLVNSFQKPSPTLTNLVLSTIFRFTGDPIPNETIEQIIAEGGSLEPSPQNNPGPINSPDEPDPKDGTGQESR